MEHRWGERIKVDIPVQIAAPPLSLRPARIANLSLSGACIKADYDLRALSRVEVVIALPFKAGGESSRITAYVTRSNKSGIGVEWCEYAPPVVNELMQTLNPNRTGRMRSSERPNRRLEALFLKHDN
jgi:hypothetical protein